MLMKDELLVTFSGENIGFKGRIWRHATLFILSTGGILTILVSGLWLVPNMLGIIPAEICDQYRVKFGKY